MKQIPFTLEAFGPDGLLKEGYDIKYRNGKKPDFVKPYDNLFIISVTDDGSVVRHFDSGLNKNGFPEKEFDLFMYRRTRTAPEVAMSLMFWHDLTPSGQKGMIDAVQAGMDEMSNQ